MPEPAKDTAIEITPKARAASSVGVPRIVAEINRVAIILTYFAYALQKTLSPIKYESDGSFAHLSAHVFRFFSASSSEEKHTPRVINTSISRRRKVRITTKITFFFVAQRAYTTRAYKILAS